MVVFFILADLTIWHTVLVSTHAPPPCRPPALIPFPPRPIFIIFQIKILCQNSLTRELKIRAVGFGFKKLQTCYKILIVHMLYIVSIVAFLYFTSFDSQAYSFGFSPLPPPPPALPPHLSPTHRHTQLFFLI